MGTTVGDGTEIARAVSILGAMSPFLLILLMANLGIRARTARWLAYGAVITLSGGFLLMGLTGLIMSALSTPAGRPPAPALGSAPSWRQLGWWSLLTGIGALAALTPAIRGAAQRLLPAFEATNPVHAVSLSLAWFLLGAIAIQLALMGDLERLAEAGVRLSLAEVWAQGIGLMLLGLVGVGLGTRRRWPEVAQRLGLRRPTARTTGIAALLVGLLIAFDLAWARAWEAIDPASLEAVSRVTHILFADMANLPGALSIGITAALGEEIVYRGALQPRFGLPFTAALFAISHVQYGLSPAILEVFLIGLILGAIRSRYDLTTCMLIHFGYNTISLLVEM